MPVVPLQAGNALDQILNSLIRFFPRAFWSLLVLAVGVGLAILVSSRAESAVVNSELFADRLASPFAYGVRILLYFFAVTIALSELGLNTGVLVVFLDGLAFGLGVAVALVVGIAVGWGSKDYVAAHVEEWIRDVTHDGPGPADVDPSAGDAAADGGAPDGEGEDGVDGDDA